MKKMTAWYLDEVRARLIKIGLGHFRVEVIIGGDDDKTPVMVVTYGRGIFGKKTQNLDKYWNTNSFMRWFEGRQNYLKLSDEQKAEIKIHPEVWEAKYLKFNK